MTADQRLERLRSIVLPLPEVTERFSHGAPCFYVRNRRALCYYHDENYDHHRRPSLMCPAQDGVAEELSEAAPERFYQPTPSAGGIFSDWIGVYLDTTDARDWSEIGGILHDAYRRIAPKKLVRDMPSSPESR